MATRRQQDGGAWGPEQELNGDISDASGAEYANGAESQARSHSQWLQQLQAYVHNRISSS